MLKAVVGKITKLAGRLKTSQHWNAYYLAENGSGIPLNLGDRYTHLDLTEYAIFTRMVKGNSEESISRELGLNYKHFEQTVTSLKKRIGTINIAEMRVIALRNGLGVE